MFSARRAHSCLGVVVLLGVHLIVGSRAVPLSMVMNSPGIVIPNALDEELRDNNLDDDFTTHPLERLSSAATCLVAGVEYTHGQQIYRKDPCEFCLCLDGEMFCWWQDCPPTLEGPCKDRGPFTPCQNGAKPAPPPSSASELKSSAVAPAPTGRPTALFPTSSATTSVGPPATDLVVVTPNVADSGSDDPLEGTNEDGVGPTDATSTESVDERTSEWTSTVTPKICTVMGRQYNVGDRLPHDTGNCVECICGRGAHITCSPHQCAPATSDDNVDEINDYRPPGLRAAQPDVF